MSDPITHGPVSEIAGKLCRCSKCGIETECTPRFDFYIKRPGPDDGPLFCFACLCQDAGLSPASTSKEFKN